MVQQQARVRPRTIRAQTLDVLTRTVRGESVPGEDAAWAELVAAGVATPDRRLEPHWHQLLAEAAQAPVRFEIVSRMGRAGMRTLISLAPGHGLAVTERRRLTVTDTEVVVDAVEDAVELAIFDPSLLWPAVKRVLPPSHLLRADAAARSRDEQTVAVLRDAPERSALSDAVLADLAGADVEVQLLLQVDHGGGVPLVATRHWLEGEHQQLLEVRLVEDRAEVVQVPTGTVADEVTWLTMGALDIRSRAGAAS